MGLDDRLTLVWYLSILHNNHLRLGDELVEHTHGIPIQLFCFEHSITRRQILVKQPGQDYNWIK